MNAEYLTMACTDCIDFPVVETSWGGELVCTGCGLVVDRADLHPSVPEAAAPAPAAHRLGAKCAAPPRPRRPAATQSAATDAEVAEVRRMCNNAPGMQRAGPLACEVIRNAREAPGFRVRKGPNALGLRVAAIFHACKLASVARTAKELATAFNVPLSSLRRMIKHAQPGADAVRSVPAYSFSVPTPAACVPRFLDRIPEKIAHADRVAISKAAHEISRAHDADLRRFEPDSAIAGVIYIALGADPARASAIAQACGVCRNTVKAVAAAISPAPAPRP